MRKHLISSLAAAAAALMFVVPSAFANVPNGSLACAIRADQSGIDVTATVRTANAPTNSSEKVTAHLVAGANLSINGSPVAAGTTIGTEQSGTFDPNDSAHPFTWNEPINATPTGASITGELDLVLDTAQVTLANGQPGWHLNGAETFPGSPSCQLVIKTVTIQVPVPVPGQTVYINVPVPVPGPATTTTKTVYKYKTRVVHVTKWRHDRARFTCAAGDTKTVVYKSSIHTWFGVCYHRVSVPKHVTG